MLLRSIKCKVTNVQAVYKLYAVVHTDERLQLQYDWLYVVRELTR